MPRNSQLRSHLANVRRNIDYDEFLKIRFIYFNVCEVTKYISLIRKYKRL